MTNLKVGEHVIVCRPWNDHKTPGGQLYFTKINKILPNSGYIYVDEFKMEGFHPDTLKSGPYGYLIPLNKEILTKFYEQEMRNLNDNNSISA